MKSDHKYDFRSMIRPLAWNLFTFKKIKIFKMSNNKKYRRQGFCCHAGDGDRGICFYKNIYISYCLYLFIFVLPFFDLPSTLYGKSHVYKPNLNFLEMAHTNFSSSIRKNNNRIPALILNSNNKDILSKFENIYFSYL